MMVIPKTTQQILAGSNEKYAYRPWERVVFEDSQTIVGCQSTLIRASFDNGKKWQTMLEIEEEFEMIFLERFYGRNRASAEDVVHGLYVTENQSRDGVKTQKPLEVETSFNTIETHPFAKNYLLRCEIEYGDYETNRMSGSKTEQASLISKDFGKSFDRIFAPVEDFAVTPNVISHGTEYWFASS